MHVVGTAGHVDHGKSALVEALTGTHPDRWLEERERGMTLDLGFAHLVLDGGELEAGIVDVPGHERFLRNMIAGAAGMELLLLVVAANEGVMPQTREHLAILQYLNVAKTIVVVSKIDLVGASDRAAALAAIASELEGTIAQDAPLVAVSVVTNEGLPELRDLIAQTLRAMPARARDAPAYLPVDRVFTIPGAGTIVTGTLMQGTIATGETLSLYPGAPVRVRGLHVFGAPRERASGGSRVALNLAGVGRDDAARGSVVAGSQFAASTRFDVRVLPYGPESARFRRRTPVRAHIGAAEIQGTLVLPRERLGSGPWKAQLLLRDPTVAFPGLRFVLRNLSPNVLLGGGEILALESAPGAVSEREVRGASARAVAGVLRARSGEALEPGVVANAANLRADRTVAILEALAERGDAIAVQRPPAYVDGAAANALLARALDVLENAERDEPWSLGATSLALARALGVSEPLLMRILAAFAAQGRISHRAGYYATAGHRPRLSAGQHRLFEQIVPVDSDRPLLPAGFAAVASAVASSGVPGASKAFDTLLARGALVKVGNDLYRDTQIAEIRAKVEAFVREGGAMTAAQFRDLIGTSRKFAVPLLEWLDGRGFTVRDGDRRVLRR